MPHATCTHATCTRDSSKQQQQQQAAASSSSSSKQQAAAAALLAATCTHATCTQHTHARTERRREQRRGSTNSEQRTTNNEQRKQGSARATTRDDERERRISTPTKGDYSRQCGSIARGTRAHLHERTLATEEQSESPRRLQDARSTQRPARIKDKEPASKRAWLTCKRELALPPLAMNSEPVKDIRGDFLILVVCW